MLGLELDAIIVPNRIYRHARPRMPTRRILFMMPELSAVSERWAARMLDALAGNVAFIAVNKAKDRTGIGDIPLLELHPNASLGARILRRLRIGSSKNAFHRGLEVLKYVLVSGRIDAVFVHYLTFALRYQEVLEASGLPIFVHCHGFDVTIDLRSHWDPTTRVHPEHYADDILRLSEKAVLIANSATTAQKLYDIGVNRNNVIIKYMGVEVPEVPPRAPPIERELKVLYLGRFVDCKGPDLLIKAFELACDRGLDGRLLMAGDGPLRVTCELLRARSPYSARILLLGETDWGTSDTLFKTCHIFSTHNVTGPLTRQEEAFGVTFIEAMASGLPIVATRSGAISEIVGTDGAGILVDPGDIEAHADQLVRLAKDSEMRRKIGEAGWRRARKVFSTERERKALYEILGI